MSTNPTDQTFVGKLLTAIFVSSTAFTITPGTGGGSAFTITPQFYIKLISPLGSNTSNGTELVAASNLGYTNPSVTAITFSESAAVVTSTNAPSWTATGTWATGVLGCEIWDHLNAIRYLQGSLTTAIAASAVTSGDTVTFAIGAVVFNATAW
jgi:hypothetical protein